MQTLLTYGSNRYLSRQKEKRGLTQFCATALVFHNVAVIKRFQDFNLLHPAVRNFVVFLLQRLHSHLLSLPVIGWVIQVQSHLSKVTL